MQELSLWYSIHVQDMYPPNIMWCLMTISLLCPTCSPVLYHRIGLNLYASLVSALHTNIISYRTSGPNHKTVLKLMQGTLPRAMIVIQKIYLSHAPHKIVRELNERNQYSVIRYMRKEEIGQGGLTKQVRK